MATYEFFLANRDNTGAVDISDVASSTSGVYRICRPTAWSITVPTSGPSAVSGLATMTKVLWVKRNGTLVANALCRKVSARGDANKASATATFVDPIVMWPWRRVRDSTGNFSKPTFSGGSGPYTVGEFLFDAITNSETWENGGVDSEMLLALGSDTTTADIYAALGNFPLSIGEIASLLANTMMGEWYVTPSNTASSVVLGTLDVADRMGTNKTATISFEYGTGTNNVKDATYDEDASNYCNALWYFFDKIDDEHWNANVTRSDTNFEDPPDTDIQASIDAARSAAGYWQDMRFWDEIDVTGSIEVTDPDNPASPHATDRVMWRRLWQAEQALRLRPKRMAFGVPTEEAPRPWDDWFLGDRVSIDYAGLGLPSVAGEQRVYGFTVAPQDNSNEELVSSILTTNDAEEITG
jgi:hypothetical protein